MTDTAQEIKQLLRAQIMARSPAERFVIVAEMFDSALAVAKASLPADLCSSEIQTAILQTSLRSGAVSLVGRGRREQATLMYRR
jgi:hypothetical protein